MKTPKVVEVTWQDHTFTFGDGIPSLSEARTVGYLLRDDEDAIIVCLSLTDGRPNETQYIDKRMWVRTTTLRPAKK